MSAFPSPLKSPTPEIERLRETVAMYPPPTMVFPFISQMKLSPVARLRQRRSALPSPLKSPVPASNQLGGGRLAIKPPPAMVLPFISHRKMSPLALFRQMMSDLPSALKSDFEEAC